MARPKAGPPSKTGPSLGATRSSSPQSRWEKEPTSAAARQFVKTFPQVHWLSALESNGILRVGSIRRRTERKTRQKADTHHVRDHRIHRAQRRRPGSDRRTAAAGIPRV